MEHNLSIPEVVVRYILMMFLVIIAGIIQSPWLMIAGVAVFLSAISAYCPVTSIFRRKSR